MTDAIVFRSLLCDGCPVHLHGPSRRHDELLRFLADRPSPVMAGADE